jgi:hypothetical protein
MMRQSETGLFPALEAALKAAAAPMDAHALFDLKSVKDYAASVNRVSDYLGHMWRKGQVVRLPAPKDGSSRSRWMYEWKGHKGPALHGRIDYTPTIIADRPSILITEEGQVITIEMTNLIISIRQKIS